VNLAVRAVVLAVMLWIPLRVLGRGFLPADDALRHAAKVVSGRPWSDIVLMRPEFTADPHAGWHAVLGALYSSGLSTVDLVWFSVVAFFFVFSLGPALLLRRPEAWLLAFLLLGVAEPYFIDRWLVGRPLLLSAATVPLVCLLWPRLTGPRPHLLAFFAACAALVTWIHGSFYLLGLPVLALLGARRWTAAARTAAAFGVGVFAGACLTGHPVAHLYQSVLHAWVSAGVAKPAASLVTELQPFDGKPAVVAGFLALVAWRIHRKGASHEITRDPAVVMVVMSWAFGYVAHRFWIDWGAPALLTFAAMEIEDALQTARSPMNRLALAGTTGALLLLQTGADVQGRWTDQSERAYLSRFDANHAPWLPDVGGILYSADMGVFYSVFFTNPDAHWKYAVGFEPALMPPEEYEVYRAIKESRGSDEAYRRWVSRMRPEDRLIVQSWTGTPPQMPELEWAQPVFSIWSGRLPRAR
jgi:hypothetical protein